MTPSTSVARLAASLPVAPGFAATGQAILAAANLILPDLERGRALDACALRAAMETAFHGSDADGAWDLKIAYEPRETAQYKIGSSSGEARECLYGYISEGGWSIQKTK